MSDHDGPGGQSHGETRPAVLGGRQPNQASLPADRERGAQGAMRPRGPAVAEKAGEVATQSSWRNFWGSLWRGLIGQTEKSETSSPVTGDSSTGAAASQGSTRLKVGVVSTVGNYREHNEDNFYLPSLGGKTMGGGIGHRDASLEVPIDAGSQNIFVVADGMGGQLAGEKASQMAVDIIPNEISRRIGPGDAEDRDVQRAIKEAVAAANQEILGLSVIQTEFNNMGTTVVLMLFRGNRVHVAGIGDSRVYRVRGGQIEQLTKDHSLAQALLEAGTITAEELPHHKFNHVLYLYLGSKDARSGPEEVQSTEVLRGDRFLLASDGLTGVVTDSQIAEVITRTDDPQVAARTLMQQALDNHSKDNVTCLVIHVV
ncbi:PP2C family protein-serine/threonine phosphatase [Tundrisphaera lichenicola]|uniref:PP2C family protein-serine/threonine phosphatase n=1 Tax=Tundrisphaera lichenicola TaxID=2029860 RepID=UPI003EBC5869